MPGPRAAGRPGRAAAAQPGSAAGPGCHRDGLTAGGARRRRALMGTDSPELGGPGYKSGDSRAVHWLPLGPAGPAPEPGVLGFHRADVKPIC